MRTLDDYVRYIVGRDIRRGATLVDPPQRITMPVGFWLLWHLVALVVLGLAPVQALFGHAGWHYRDSHTAFRVAFLACYVMAAAVVAWRVRRGFVSLVSSLTQASLPPVSLLFLVLLLQSISYSRRLLLLSLALGGLLLWLPLAVRSRARTPILTALGTIAFGVVAWGALLERDPGAPDQRRRTDVTTIPTTFYTVRATTFRGNIRSRVPGGGLASVGEDYVLATGEGFLYRVTHDDDSLRAVRLPDQVPLNRGAFIADAPSNVNTSWFRTADILVGEQDGTRSLFASHHFWKRAEGCYVVRVSVARGPIEWFLTSDSSLRWTTLYESRPCLGFKEVGSAFTGLHIGGRLVFLNDHALLLSLGEHEFDGLDHTPMLSQDPTADYGKTVTVHPITGRSEVFTVGHRNPQGLYTTASGLVWETEHGPNGGDELNLLVRGENYGWPLVTYGAARGQLVWPLNSNQGRHDGFAPPVYAWLPSIGISNLIGVERELFDVWHGDLLIASLRDASLFRIRLRNGAVAAIERIPVGLRLRDIVEDRAGRIVLWTDDAAIVILQPLVEADATLGPPVVSSAREPSPR